LCGNYIDHTMSPLRGVCSQLDLLGGVKTSVVVFCRLLGSSIWGIISRTYFKSKYRVIEPAAIPPWGYITEFVVFRRHEMTSGFD
jgi:hypothetical protein